MRYAHQKYTWEKPFGSVRHMWQLVGPKGGIHFTANIWDRAGSDPACGLEVHYYEAPDYRRDEAPSQVNCWLIGGRCWHDGTSLYASETLWPMIVPMLRSGDHDSIFRLLEHEADQRFRCEAVEEAA
jgi:hypothetical protein